jgi:hypothetical protein
MIQTVRAILSRVPTWVAVVVFVLLNAAQMMWSGVRIGGDSGMYLDGALNLAGGQPLSVRQPSYAAYIAFLALVQSTGVGLIGVVAAQLAAACGAAVVVGKMAAQLAGHSAAVLAILMFAMDFDTNRWHAFILSDSLFLSLLVGSVWLVYRALPLRAGGMILAVVATLAAALVRPEGWFLVPAAMLFWIAYGTSRIAIRVAAVAALVVAAGILTVAVAPRLSGNLAAVGPADMLRRGQTIWDFDGWRVPMPADAVFDDGRASTADALVYGMRHPLSTAALMAARVAVHFAHVRPFFSGAHNAALVSWLMPVYLLTLSGLWRWWRHPMCRWVAMAIASQTLVVALTHADWDGRYLSHVLPLMYPLAAAALATALTKAGSSKELGVTAA